MLLYLQQYAADFEITVNETSAAENVKNARYQDIYPKDAFYAAVFDLLGRPGQRAGKFISIHVRGLDKFSRWSFAHMFWRAQTRCYTAYVRYLRYLGVPGHYKLVEKCRAAVGGRFCRRERQLGMGL